MNLKELRDAADDACGKAFSANIEGAINWGDLGCVSAERYEDDIGHVGFRVLIEEADPGALELREFVAESLEAAGFPRVEVVTEW